ncbi:DUF5050 domain-containing protein [Clostridium botulinum]|uniref:DUF5050 domain-containing protein n=1 Tax=Clostridium botulinum TaxID=1491 RepID=UPI0004D3597A|nr:DUF5050 domain-containing protein [Clostridium botulinum]KEI07489.1 hypothetical protein Z952_03980 [Clostridium botulinum C/D str. BKT75002]KEI09857.1 hypothetical protein Z954_11330 [Clostridium botulinum C/D str. BKT2873]MCD3350988.1 DUF5050 domain-containing protein [Clostridium botulinum D/C]MCD3359944.1 DUF5050 domain-containing protein [Clostridium botulinum D/C]MCD3361833.1 DUF5050 domain-containing protein [Clostridium botulinum D/C]
MRSKINKKIIAFFMCYMLCVSLFPSCAFAQNNPVEKGIVNNRSLLVKEGDWLYYRNSYDGGSIYKVKTDGTQNTKINDISSCNITLDRDWIYFRSLAPKNKFYELFRVKKDGAGLQDLNVKAHKEKIIGEWIYYIPGTNFYDSHDGICKMKKDGSCKTSVLKQEEIVEPNIKNNCLIYDFDRVFFFEDNKNLELNDPKHKFDYDSKEILNVSNEWIYFKKLNGTYYRMRHDLSNEEVLRGEDGYTGDYYIVNDNWIYNTQTQCLETMDRSKGIGKRTLGKNVDYSKIKIVDNWIYYYCDDGFCRIKADGTNKTKIYDFMDTNIDEKGNNIVSGYNIDKRDNYIVSGDNIYYINDYNKSEKAVLKFNLKDKTTKELVHENVIEVKPQKQWKINFNKKLNKNTINKNNIVVSDGDNKTLAITTTIGDDGKSVYIKSNGDYDNCWDVHRIQNGILCGKQIYKIKISTNVKSEDGKGLNKEVIKKFKVEDDGHEG